MLTERQKRFVDAYAGNGVAAARAAGYTGSDAALAVTASRLLRHPAVSSALDDRLVAKSARERLDAIERPVLHGRAAAFVASFVECSNAAAAARAAGYSERCASQAAHRLLSRADVQAAVEAARTEREVRSVASVRELQERLTTMARDDRRDDKVRLVAMRDLAKLLTPSRVPVANPEPARPRLKLVGNNGRGPTPREAKS